MITLTERQIEALRFTVTIKAEYRRTTVRIGKKLLAAGLATLVKKDQEDAFGNFWRVDSYFINDEQVDLICEQFPEITKEREPTVINFTSRS